MRTNIEIDDALMKKAMKASEATTKKAVVEEALQMFVRIKGQGAIRKYFGKVKWEGDLDEMRRSKHLDAWDRPAMGESLLPLTSRKKAA